MPAVAPADTFDGARAAGASGAGANGASLVAYPAEASGLGADTAAGSIVTGGAAGGRGAAAWIGDADDSIFSDPASGANGACCGAYPSEVARDVPDAGVDAAVAVDEASASVALGGTGAAGN